MLRSSGDGGVFRGGCGRAYRPGTWLWEGVVVGVPLLALPVDLAVAPAERPLHLGHGECTDRRAPRCPFVPGEVTI